MKYIITDPCYIVPEDVWDKACQYIDDDAVIDYANFEKVISDACGTKVDCCDTGCGDWDNSISGPHDNIINKEFCADSGMVCFAQLTPEIENNMAVNDINLANNSVAVVIDVSDAHVEWHGNDEWTIASIRTPEGYFYSEDYPADDDDDDWDDEWDDEDEN